jgi:8-oxo-dGTP pyrophosphatase MutT (NUDIX family)
MSRCAIPTEDIDPVDLRARIVRNLSAHRREEVVNHGLKVAAVVVALLRNEKGEDCFVLIRRARRLRAHAGQWALPGGRVEESETIVEAGLRELTEEVGLRVSMGAVLGLLDDYTTRSGFVITPVVVWCEDVSSLQGDPAEVAEVHDVPLSELLKPDVPRLRTIPQSDRPVISIPLVGTHVHAPTAAVLFQFREVGLLARTTRVAHYEQPVFAWK